MTLVLREGYDAMAAAAVDCGCRFFAGYPMLPFTGLLDAFARELPRTGGVLIQADTEIEGANMALGAAATGARAATGSTGQGVALMQETIAEAALNELPVVFFNVARGQQDYFQATRGGGWGDYRTIALAPASVVEAAELTTLAFELADRWMTPVLFYADHMIGFTQMTVEHEPAGVMKPQPEKPWALDGSSGGTGRSKVVWTWRQGKHNTPGPGPNRHWQSVAEKYGQVAAVEARHVARHTDDAEVVVVSFGTTGAFVDYVVDELRADGHRIGTFRPVTLWPFPSDALLGIARSDTCKLVLVHELNAGQMIDDVRLAIEGARPVRAIGGVSQDESGMRQGDLLQVDVIRARILSALKEAAKTGATR
jgi:2-oxoglutarate ferredoxin oxidoreductase subunit alpha